MIRKMGVRYVTITTKHCEGFCLWDSKFTDFNIAATPYGRDLLGPLVKAMTAEGVDVHFYYSIIDWHHPDYRAAILSPDDRRAFDRYFEFMKNQLRELLMRYPEVGTLWFDGQWDASYCENPEYAERLEAFLRKVKPGIIINNRIGAGLSGNVDYDAAGRPFGDYNAGYERILPHAGSVPLYDWEAGMTLPENQWGYRKVWTGHVKTAAELAPMLAAVRLPRRQFHDQLRPQTRWHLSRRRAGSGPRHGSVDETERRSDLRHARLGVWAAALGLYHREGSRRRWAHHLSHYLHQAGEQLDQTGGAPAPRARLLSPRQSPGDLRSAGRRPASRRYRDPGSTRPLGNCDRIGGETMRLHSTLRCTGFRLLALSFLISLAALARPLPAPAQQTNNGELRAVPAPEKVAIDGNLDDWDLSGEILICYDLARLADVYSVRAAAMYDATNLYLSFRFKDKTPLVNYVDPKAEPNGGWKSDSVELRMKTDRVAHLECWYYTGRKEPAMTIHYGMWNRTDPDYADLNDAIAAGAREAFLVGPGWPRLRSGNGDPVETDYPRRPCPQGGRRLCPDHWGQLGQRRGRQEPRRLRASRAPLRRPDQSRQSATGIHLDQRLRPGAR